MVTRTAIVAGLPLLNDADRIGVFAAVGELRCVMQDEHRTCLSASRSLLRAVKMPCKNLFFINAFVRKETISCLRGSPVLAGKRNASTDLPG